MLSKEEKLSRSDLNSLIDKKIRAITRLAYDHNPFLHGLFESAGMNPHSDVSSRSDLLKAYKRGVRTTGADLESCYADYASELPLLEIWSSGSSGKSKKVLLSRNAMEQVGRGQERLLSSAGVSDGQKVLGFPAPPPYATSYAFQRQPFLSHLKIRTFAFRVPTIPKNITRAEKMRIARSYIEMIYDFNPDHVRGGTFVLRNFAELLTDFGFDRKKISVKSAIFSGDPTTEEQRKKIGTLWNAEPFDVYGTSEMGIVGYECRSHSGLHMNEGDLCVTSVDPKSGEEVNENEQGRDLCTLLFEDGELPATFFINYSHGDKISMLPEICSCGNGFRLSTHPTRDSKKVSISGFGFDIKEEIPFLKRAARKMRSTLR